MPSVFFQGKGWWGGGGALKRLVSKNWCMVTVVFFFLCIYCTYCESSGPFVFSLFQLIYLCTRKVSCSYKI